MCICCKARNDLMDYFSCFFLCQILHYMKTVGEDNIMTQISAKQLTKRVQQLDDAQAGTILLFIEFLLTQPNLKERQNGWRDNKKTLEALNRVYGGNSVDPNATYKLALRAMMRKDLPKRTAAVYGVAPN